MFWQAVAVSFGVFSMLLFWNPVWAERVIKENRAIFRSKECFVCNGNISKQIVTFGRCGVTAAMKISSFSHHFGRAFIRGWKTAFSPLFSHRGEKTGATA